MRYDIEIGPKAKKTIKRMQNSVASHIIKKIYQLKENPYRYLEHFEGNGYKLRIGKYRALIDVDSINKILVVRVLDKRGRIYKR